MRSATYLLILCLFALAGRAMALNESEPNGARGSANGPFSFPSSLTGNFLQDGEGIVDYFQFTASAGITYAFSGTVTGGPTLGADLVIEIENGAGGVLATADTNANGGSESLQFVAPSSGTFYIVLSNFSGAPNGFSSYNINASIVTPADSTPPTYAGTAGINTASRLNGNYDAALTWFQASDNLTAQNQIRYDIFYATTAGAVFSSGVKATVTGALATTISGLDPLVNYFFGVRAKDEAGNSETNTRTVEAVRLNAAGNEWSLYE